MIPAFGNICQILTKHMHMLICCKSSWDDVILMNDSILEELRSWYFQCIFLSFKCVIPVHRIPQRVICTDANQFVGAGFIVNANKIVHFMFDTQDRENSFTWKKMKTVQSNILSLRSDLSGKFIKLYTDNQNVVQKLF